MNNNTLSEDFGNLQNDGSENLKIFPNHSETNFVPFRKPSERKLSHTLTVREVARIFEEHDVPITEHTVTNWCKQNSQGICRLDGYYEEAERKWYITPESVDLTIKEERTKLRKDILNHSEAAQNFSEAFGNVRKEGSENVGNVPNHSENNFGKAEKSEDKAQKNEPENVATRESSDNEKELIR
jgi:hypothetical protein